MQRLQKEYITNLPGRSSGKKKALTEEPTRHSGNFRGSERNDSHVENAGERRKETRLKKEMISRTMAIHMKLSHGLGTIEEKMS